MTIKIIVRLAFLLLLAMVAVEANKFRKLLDSKLVELTAWAKAQLGDRPMKAPVDYPYWSFMPQYTAAVFPTGKTAEWSSPCFQSNLGRASYSADGKTVDIKITSSKPVQEGSCSDSYMTITSGALVTRTKIESSKLNPVVFTSITLELPADLTEGEQWDIDNKGVRMMRYVNGELETISGLIQTLEMFVPEFTPSPPAKIAEANRDFLNKYASTTIVARDASSNVVPAESEVRSGNNSLHVCFHPLKSLLSNYSCLFYPQVMHSTLCVWMVSTLSWLGRWVPPPVTSPRLSGSTVPCTSVKAPPTVHTGQPITSRRHHLQHGCNKLSMLASK